VSIFAKAGEFEHLYFYNIGSPNGNNGVWFNLTTGSVGTNQAAWTSAKMEDFGNGWYRCSAIVTPGGSSDNIYILLADSNGSVTATTSGTDGLYIWGAQLEEGSYPTSYIPNHSGGTITRGADVATDAIANTSGQYWTLFIDYANFKNGDTSGDGSMAFKDSSNTTIFHLWGLTAGFVIRSFSGDSNGRYYTNDGLGLTAKAVIRYDGTEIGLFIDGVKQTITSPSPLESNWNQLYKVDTLKAADNKYNFNQMLVFPEALSDADCIAITTL
jgi:hypothetical protein